MTVKSSGALLLPDVHLMLRGSSGRVRELGRGDRDRYACCYMYVASQKGVVALIGLSDEIRALASATLL